VSNSVDAAKVNTFFGITGLLLLVGAAIVVVFVVGIILALTAPR
jgi:uncharacterized membrane protein